MSLSDNSEKSVKTWTALGPGEKLVEYPRTMRALRPDDVRVKMLATGICFTDIDATAGHHQAFFKFPLTAGHEGVGVIIEKGSLVQHRSVGQRVGLGCYRSCCSVCKTCRVGEGNGCPHHELMYRDNIGTFCEEMVINFKFAIPIPDEIPTEYAGPLMCAGTTVFAPFRNLNIKSGDHVGVVGIGGLGHLALRFARAYGCRVTAFSRGTSKEESARGFGAHAYVDTSKSSFSSQVSSNPVDFILVTASGPSVDYTELIRCLAFNGQIVVIGITGGEISIPLVELLVGQKAIVGSAAGSYGLSSDMLEFAALHRVLPDIEIFTPDQFNDAIKKVVDGTIRFRAVVKFSQ
eukprot:TRINITY_DN5867_c0_g1_i4.p1 TRINITY_DN5867_c0_g1~~TRINITY_DN5867_c0_g1_i4.p1  ORF type:complete len:392 (-),score=59.45 TRINITY_DN5867_c0_g1_i4:45-1088(-)